MKKPYKGKGKFELEVKPGEEKVLVARVKNGPLEPMKFPPALDIEIEGAWSEMHIKFLNLSLRKELINSDISWSEESLVAFMNVDQMDFFDLMVVMVVEVDLIDDSEMLMVS